MPLTIEAVNPLDHRRELLELFVRYGVAHYPAFQERAYPVAVAAGAVSWIGVEDGRIAMHMARFPQPFSVAGRRVTGGLLVNMMVDEAHRTFFPALAMVRKMVKDSKADPRVDFLYGNPNEGGAMIVKSAGLKVVATLRRYALPLGGGSFPSNVAARAYGTLRRLASPGRELAFTRHEAAGFDLARFENPARTDRVTTFHPAGQYTIWLAEYPSPDHIWFTFPTGSAGGDAAVLVRKEPLGMFGLFVVRRPPEVSLGSLLWPISGVLRGLGGKTLQVWTLEESHFAVEVRRVGFVPREDAQPFFALPLTEAGAEAIRAIKDWEITVFDCDR